MNKNKILKLIISILICEVAGIIGSLFTSPAIASWYATINKPTFNPPNWIFAPVWTLLFLLMGVALYLVWNKGLDNKQAKIAVSIFSFQLALNILWSVLFFGLQSPFLALIEILILWLAILFTLTTFYRISKAAGLMLLPYSAWVTFAAVLNFAIWQLNL